jgi:TIR domain
MAMKVFVSYNHKQGDWVFDRLVPCLEAGGAEVLIDRKRFESGGHLLGQIDAAQAEADKQVLVLTPDYDASHYCQHELNNALARDPGFVQKIVQPVLLQGPDVPAPFKGPGQPIWVDLRDDTSAAAWEPLMKQCAPDLGTDAAHWLAVRDDVRARMDANQSVELIVSGRPKWESLVRGIAERPGKGFPLLFMNDGRTITRDGFVTAMLEELGATQRVMRPPNDLPVLSKVIGQRSDSKIGLLRFQTAAGRTLFNGDLHGAFRYLIRDTRKLTMLVQTRVPFSEVLVGHALSSEDFLTPIRLEGR